MARQRHVLLGHVLGAHGIRGEVLVRAYTDDPASFARYRTVTVVETGRSLGVKRARVTPKGLVVAFDDVADRTAAEALRGVGLQVDRAALPPAGDREYYHADLIGLELRSRDGARIGRIVNVANFGAGDLLEIELPPRKGTEFVPFDDDVVPHIDLDAGYAVLDLSRLGGDDADERHPDDTDA